MNLISWTVNGWTDLAISLDDFSDATNNNARDKTLV